MGQIITSGFGQNGAAAAHGQGEWKQTQLPAEAGCTANIVTKIIRAFMGYPSFFEKRGRALQEPGAPFCLSLARNRRSARARQMVADAVGKGRAHCDQCNEDHQTQSHSFHRNLHLE
jgi:hypothetical protein